MEDYVKSSQAVLEIWTLLKGPILDDSTCDLHAKRQVRSA